MAQPVSRGPADRRGWRRLLSAAALVVFLGAALAADPPADKEQPFEPNIADPEHFRNVLARIAGLYTSQQPLEVVNLFVAATQPPPARPPLVEKPQPRKITPFIDRDLLIGMIDKADWETLFDAEKGGNEPKQYRMALMHAREVPLDDMAKAARRDITFEEIWTTPSLYRGEIVHLEGRLKLLRRHDAPRILRKEGVPKVYEAWIYGVAYNSNPMCVHFTELPEELNPHVGRQLSDRDPTVWVTCDGYFLKLISYVAGGPGADMEPSKKHRRAAPLLVARAITPMPNQEPDSYDIAAGFGSFFVPAAIIAIIALITLATGLGWWFKRGDQRVRSRILDARYPSFVEPPPDGDKEIPPLPPSRFEQSGPEA